MKYTILLFLIFIIFSCTNKQQLSSEPFKNIRLHDIWALDKMNGQQINRLDVHQTPYIEIHVKDKKIYGNDGCNELSGTISILDNTNLKFDKIEGTEKQCLEMEIPNKFLKRMKEVKQYKLEGLKLYFFNKKKKEVLQFRKVD